jgi:aspartate/methionine/tyrosine aminotransferase
LAQFKDYTTICGSAPSEILALMALKSKEAIIRRNLELIGRNMNLLENFFTKHIDLFEWSKPKAGTIGFPRLLSDEKIDVFCADLVEKKGVMILPATVYGYQGNNFRIGLGRRNMPVALGRLEEYLQKN